MKYINKYICLVAAVFMFSSCEDFLTIPSATDIDDTQAFSSIDKAEMVVLAGYSTTFGREFYYQFGMGTDACYSTESETNSKNQVSNFVYTPANTPNSTYKSCYQGIDNSNVCIPELEAMLGSYSAEGDKKRIEYLLGESLALRGMNYFNVVRLFGDVPFSLEPSKSKDDFLSPRVSRDIILDQAVADLQRAVGLLPWQSEGVYLSPERFTKNSALAILARVSLTAAGYSLRWDLETNDAGSMRMARRDDDARVRELYQIASDACGQLIQSGENTLLSDYSQVFKDLINDRYNKETLLEVSGSAIIANGATNNLGYTNGMQSDPNSLYKKSGPQMCVIPTFYFDYSDADQRRDVTIINFDVNSQSEFILSPYATMNIGKFRVDWKEETTPAVNRRGLNWPMIRYSDVLLMYAEAQNELNGNPTAEATAAIKEVLMRAYNNDDTQFTIPSDYDGFFNLIVDERKKELAFEAYRKNDLIRWNLLTSKLTEEKAKVIAMATAGPTADVPGFRVYDKITATDLPNDITAVPFETYVTMTIADSTNLANSGKLIMDMFSDQDIAKSYLFAPDEPWLISLFRGLEENKVELYPIPKSIVDANPQIKQHPKY